MPNTSDEENGDDVLTAITKYQNHLSIKVTLEKCIFSFSSETVSLIHVEKEMKSLDANKASHPSDISTKTSKQSLDLFFLFISSYVNKLISSSTFPSIIADITPVYKKIFAKREN